MIRPVALFIVSPGNVETGGSKFDVAADVSTPGATRSSPALAEHAPKPTETTARHLTGAEGMRRALTSVISKE
jgi:hypothetical protein